MSYENPPLPQEVNVSRESAVIEFVRLTAALAFIVALLGAVLYVSGGWLARLIPYELEVAWSGDRTIGIESGDIGADGRAIEVYLQEIAGQLAATMDLPPGMKPRVHYADIEVPNAFAMLGGHIVITGGLYRRMPSENALALVIAHEIGHISARDPISALGGSAALQLALVLIGADAGQLAPHIARLVQLSYSRRAEAHADAMAVDAVRLVYGHLGGTAATFEILADYQDDAGGTIPSLLSTHPADAERIARLTGAAHGWDPVQQPLRTLAISPP